MALQVWMPLNGNLKNIGSKSVQITKLGDANLDGEVSSADTTKITRHVAQIELITDPVAFDNADLDRNGDVDATDQSMIAGNTFTYDKGIEEYEDGKIGQALVCDGTHHWRVTGIELDTSATICCWLKISTSKAEMAWVLNATSNSNLNLYIYSTGYYLNIGDGANNPFKDASGSNVANYRDGLWHHLAVTFDGSQCLLYVDGEYAGKAKTYRAPTTTADKYIRFGGGYANKTQYDIVGSMNDFRVYDECLSAAEIRDIAKALVCHYKLDGYDEGNLIPNGFGRDGNKDWTITPSTTDKPDVAGCEASFGTGWNQRRILIDPSATYTLSLYCKGGTTTTTYASLCPFDDDMERMEPWEVTGFHSTARTTLSQELKPGDTEIHCTSLANFVTTSGSSYTRIAVFGYRAATGKLYADYTYTADTVSLGTGTTFFNNINKTTNIITLPTAWDGAYRPAGTAICQTASSAQYYYPMSWNSTNYPDWTSRETSFTPSNVAFLKYATYMQFGLSNGSGRAAAISLTKGDSYLNIIDSSGYNNNGTASDVLDTSVITGYTNEPDLPRYDKCLSFASAATNFINIGQAGKLTDEITFCAWAAMDRWIQNPRIISCTESGGWVFEGGGNYMRIAMHINNTYVYATSTGHPFTSLSNGWHHFAGTYDGYTLKFYVDGELAGTSATSSTRYPIHYHASNNIIVGAEAGPSTAYSVYFDGKISDVRIYGSALSSNEIKDLYNLGARIDNLNSLHSFKLIEDKTNLAFEMNTDIMKDSFNSNMLYRYTQANCQVTATDQGVRIYRPPNLTPSDDGNTMWGGLYIRNTDNRLNLQKGHTYLLAMTISGKSNNIGGFEFANLLGWGGGGLQAQPTIIYTHPLPEDFQEENHNVWRVWTINDDVWKTCTSSYSGFVKGHTYVSYRDLAYRFTYTSTGAMGTDIYVNNIRLFDITDLDLRNITKAGIANFTDFVEDAGISSINMNYEFFTNRVNEI